MNDMFAKFAAQANANAAAFSAQYAERAKDMMSKSGQLSEEAAAFNKSNLEALVESSKIMLKNMEVLRGESLGLARQSVEDASLVLQSFSGVTSPAEFFKIYADNRKKAFDSAAAEAARGTEMLIKMGSESFTPISNRLSVIRSQMKAA